jgi:hypothetical protein
LQDDALPDHDPIKVESRVKPFVCDLFPKSGSHFGIMLWCASAVPDLSSCWAR